VNPFRRQSRTGCRAVLAGHDLRLLLVELRNFYLNNSLTNGKAAWSECEVVVDMNTSKIFFDFKYE